MNPKIILISGTREGFSVELSESTLSIGRDETNDLALEDKMISRCHCVIKKHKGLYKICDLQSHNGTLVNGIPVNEQILTHGDRIQIGGSIFLFLSYEDKDLTVSNAVNLDDSKTEHMSAVNFSQEDALNSMVRDLSLLMKVSQIINVTNSLKSFQRQLLESILEAIPAQRGAIMLSEEGIETPSSVFVIDRSSKVERPFHVSRTAANKVLTEGVAILSDNVLESEELSKSESLVEAQIRSLLCVPLKLRDRVIGILYLETSEPEARLNDRHLQIAIALTAFVSGPLDSLRQREWLVLENQRLNDDLRVEHNMVGESAPMVEIYQFISKVAPSDSTILIRGHSGTGKELVARAIHQNSPRASKPLISVNCAALSDTLLESELFGHEKGAFTGAYIQKKGKLELANGGTLFLDEVAEMPPQVQAKLLRVLQEREFERVGGTRTIKVDVRILAATNQDLEQQVRDGDFRQDLYYRLNVISRTIPPLSERREDIHLLASYFVVKYAEKCHRRVSGLSAEARACLLGYHWPGNVRELENAIERAVVLGETDYIQPEDLPEHILEASPLPQPHAMGYNESLREAKKQLLLSALNKAGGRYIEAARSLGIHPNNLHRMLRNLGLKEVTNSVKKD